MNHLRLILVDCYLILCVGFLFTGPFALASEEIGGQISTTGKISFYEETAESSSSVPSEPSIVSPNETSKKHLPDTGEWIRTYSFIGGSLILLSLLLLFLQKCRKGE